VRASYSPLELLREDRSRTSFRKRTTAASSRFSSNWCKLQAKHVVVSPGLKAHTTVINDGEKLIRVAGRDSFSLKCALQIDSA
jgi:hypothetical protein